jgi:hypothetical protein
MGSRTEFKEYEPLKLLLSAMPSKKKSGMDYKYEPIFVYQKN